MHTRSTHHKFGAIALLVLFITGLLPAQPGLAAPGRLPAAQEENPALNVSPAQVRSDFWLVNAMSQVDGAQRAEMLAFELVLMHMYKQNPDLPVSGAVQRIRDLQSAYRNSSQNDLSRHTKTANERVLAIFALLASPPFSNSADAGAIAAGAYDAYTLTLRDSLSGGVIGADRVFGAAEAFFPQLAQEEAQEALLLEVLAFADQNPRFAEAFDALWAADLKVGIHASTAEIIQSSPSLQALTQITALVDESGAVATDLNTVKGFAADEFLLINATMTTTQQLMLQLDEHQRDMIAYTRPSNEAQRNADKKLAEDNDKLVQAQLKQSEEALAIAAKLAKYVDADFATSLKFVSEASTTLAKAFSKHAIEVAGLSVAKAVFSFNTVELIGTVAGVVLKLTGLFDDEDKPSPEQQILTQIGELRKQINQLGVTMNKRFDRIDRTLNQLFNVVVTEFAKINLITGETLENVEEVRDSLTSVQTQLNRVELALTQIAVDQAEYPLIETMHDTLGYLERTGEPMEFTQTTPNYASTETRYYSFAREQAFRTPYVTVISGLDDAQVYTHLSNNRPDEKLDYLSAYIANDQGWNLPALYTPTLTAYIGNPRAWVLGARAYAELELDMPGHAVRINESRTSDLVQRGQQLRDALRAITVVQTPEGPRANYPLFTRLIDNYLAKAAAFDASLTPVEEFYLSTVQTSYNRTRAGRINPWGGLGQPVNQLDLLPGPGVPACGQTSNPRPVPSNFAAEMLPNALQLAQYFRPDPEMQALLDGDKITACYTEEWVDRREVIVPTFPEPTEETRARLRVEIVSQYSVDGTPQVLRRRSIRLPEQVIDPDGPFGPRNEIDPGPVAAANWDSGQNIKQRFESGSTLDHDAGAPASVNTAVEAELRSHQQQVYHHVLLELGRAGPVSAAANQFAGAKALIENFIALGMPRALESDEYLRQFLYGNQGLLTQTPQQPYLSQIWTAALVTPPAHNVRADAQALATARATALRELLWHYFGLIDAGQYGESHRMLETTLDRLKIANLMIRKPVLSLSASQIALGAQFIGAPAVTRTLTLTNSGLAKPIEQISLSMLGSNPVDFARSSTCGAALAPGASCTVTISFQPTGLGDRAAQLRLASSAPGAPHTIALSGRGELDALFIAPEAVNEGSSIELALRNPADPTNEAPWGAGYSYAFDCGAGYGAFGSASSISCPTTDNGERAARAKVRDSTGQTLEYSTSVSVVNVAPAATLSAPPSADEGGAITLALNDASDPSSADLAAGLQYAFNCGAGYSEFGAGNSVSCPLPDSGAYSVGAIVRDKDGGVSEYSASVSAANVAPVGSLQAPPTLNEGGSIALAITDVSDPSGIDLASLEYAFDCGAGYGEFGPDYSASCPTADNGAHTVRGKVRDKDGGVSEYSASVSVANVAPTATLRAPASVNEGGPITLSLTNIVDSSSADRASLEYAFDCGAGYGEFGRSSSVRCPTEDNGVRTVRAMVRDKDGGVSEYSAEVIIVNVAPTATLTTQGPFYSGQTFGLELTAVADAPADQARLEYAFDCGDGAGFGPFASEPYTNCAARSAGQLLVKGRIRDKEGAFSEYSAWVTIEDALVITQVIPADGESFEVDTPVKLIVEFSDAEPKGGYNCLISWGDASGREIGFVTDLGNGGVCEAAHTYTTPGEYQIQVELTSAVGNTTTTTVNVRIFTMEK